MSFVVFDVIVTAFSSLHVYKLQFFVYLYLQLYYTLCDISLFYTLLLVFCSIYYPSVCRMKVDSRCVALSFRVITTSTDVIM